MIGGIKKHLVKSTHALIRKGAVMSKEDARRNKMLAIASPLLFLMFLVIEITEPSETVIMKCLMWWLITMLGLSSILIPVTVYGYNNRHDINVEDEEPLNYAPGMIGAALGTALVPLALILFDHFGIN
jgi:hypothetical protein